MRPPDRGTRSTPGTSPRRRVEIARAPPRPPLRAREPTMWRTDDRPGLQRALAMLKPPLRGREPRDRLLIELVSVGRRLGIAAVRCSK